MTRILIVESNTPDMLARGASDARPFLDTLPRLDSRLDLHVVEPHAAPVTTADLDWADGVVLTGAGVDWCVDDPRGTPVAEAMRAALDTGRPVWGSCNGMQLAAWLLGGACGASANGREDGVARNIALTDAGRAHPMMQGRCDGFAVPSIHRDEVTKLPEGAVLLAGNAHSPVQAMIFDRDGIDFWGTQYHPEFTLAEIVQMIAANPTREQLDPDVSAAATDPEAGARAGIAPGSLSFEIRTTELRNWLHHVKSRAGDPTQL